MLRNLQNLSIGLTLFLISTAMVGQTPPPIGMAADFALFTSVGAISNGVSSQITGKVGTNGGGACTGFGNVNGQMHIGDAVSAQCAIDLGIAYTNLSGQIPGATIGLTIGAGQVLSPNVYMVPGAGTLLGSLTLDGGGDPNACFVLQINGAFVTTASSKIILKNGTKACNVFWRVDGQMSLVTNTSFKGTAVVAGAIQIGVGCMLEGRVLSVTGAVTVSAATVTTPIGCGSPILFGPVAPDLCAIGCFAMLTSNGTITNTGTTNIVGDIGTNNGVVSGIDPLGAGGTIHAVPNATTSQASLDLSKLYTYLNGLPTNIELLYPVLFGHSQVLTPHVYLMNAATVLTDTIFLDARGVTDAVFVIRVMGALTTGPSPQVVLVGGAQANNVFWQVEGAVTISGNGDFKGIILANNGEIILNTGVVLSGVAFSTNGNITTQDVEASSPNPRTWRGSINSEWSNADNWYPPSVPTPCTDVFIPSLPAGTPFPYISATNAVCRNLTISPGASLGLLTAFELSVNGNWINKGTFIPTAGSVAFTGTTNQTIGGSKKSAFYNLTINNTSAAGITLERPESVTGILTLTNGLFYTTSTNLLTLNSGSSIGAVSDSSFVLGPIAKVGNSNFTFPVGKGSKYRPIGISTLTGSETFTAEYFYIDPNTVPYDVTNKDATLDRISRCEYWMLNRTGTQNAFVTLSWDSYSCGVDAIADLAIVRWDGGGWEDHGQINPTGSPDPGTGTITTNAPVTSFSPFTLASTNSNNTLPITLLSFTATPSSELSVKSVVDIQWSTSAEINNDYFDIERSIDAINFTSIKKIGGAGNSNQIINYSTVDEAPINGISYYRLKQTDYDGTTSYSSMQAVQFNKTNDFAFNLYPNPNNGELFYFQISNSNEEVLVVVHDMLGKKVYSKTIAAWGNGTHTIQPSQKLNPGTYLITAALNNEIYQKRLLVR
jgi:hypothetical protein